MNLRHLGLRAQIILSLAALLVVVFSFTGMALLWVLRASLESQRRELGTATATVFVEGVASRFEHELSPTEAATILEASLGRAGIVAIGYYDALGEPVVRRALDGDGPELEGISTRRPRQFQTIRPAADGSGDELLLIQPVRRGRGALAAVVNLGVTTAELGRLARPVLIYLLTSGFLLLGFGYIALTRLIVRPLELLTQATEQVAAGRVDVSVPVGGGREIASAATAFNTMTKRIRAQKERLEAQVGELERTTKELCSTQEQLVRSAKLASVGTLAAGVAHEVGNPVSAIMGLSEVLSEGGDDLEAEERQEYQQRIQSEAERVNRIIRDLLEYARSTPEEMSGPTSVADAAEAAVGLMSPQKQFRLIDVQLVVEEDLPAVDIGMDPLTQVLLNLLLNAADAVSGEGLVVVRAKYLSETELPKRPGAEAAVQIDVSDSGPGVPEEELEKIFEPFFTTKDPGKGTGLGLAMCESIVSRAGGIVTAKNNAERGLTISLVLPLAADHGA